MHFPSALVAATSLLALVPQASAFLIPADIAEDAVNVKDEIWKALHLDQAHNVEVECKDCPFFETKKKLNGIEVVGAKTHDDNKIPLRFETVGNVLRVNGEAIYPLSEVNKHFPKIRVHQSHEDGSEGIEIPVGFAVHIKSPFTPGNPKEKYELVPIEFNILDLDHVNVKVDSVLLDVVRDTEDGTLQIANSHVYKFEETPETDACENTSNWSMCRVQAMMTEKLRAMMEEAKAKTSGMKEWAKTHAGKKGCGGKFGKHGKFGKLDKDGKPAHPHSHPHGPHHDHHHRAHRFAHMVHRFINFVVVPVLLGVAGGIMASAVGMLVGQIIVFCWLKFYRGGHRGPVENVRIIEIEVEEGEKEGLMVEEMEAPPTYTDVRDEETKVTKE